MYQLFIDNKPTYQPSKTLEYALYLFKYGISEHTKQTKSIVLVDSTTGITFY